jgi:lipopolysaccharide export system protein LptA
MNTAVQDRYEAKYLDEKKQKEAWNTDMQYKSKHEAEKIKGQIDIDRETHRDTVDADKLKASTTANKWTGNMPDHHFEGK